MTAAKLNAAEHSRLLVRPLRVRKYSLSALLRKVSRRKLQAASRVKGYPFEVLLPQGLGVEGAIVSDQIKRRIGAVPADVLQETVGKILALVDPDGAQP